MDIVKASWVQYKGVVRLAIPFSVAPGKNGADFVLTVIELAKQDKDTGEVVYHDDVEIKRYHEGELYSYLQRYPEEIVWPWPHTSYQVVMTNHAGWMFDD
jgi:hypothetical protein